MNNYNLGISMLFIGVGIGWLDKSVEYWRGIIFIGIGLTLLIIGEIREHQWNNQKKSKQSETGAKK